MNTAASTTLSTAVTDSPVGALTLVASDAGLRAILWPDDDPARVRLSASIVDPGHPVIAAAVEQLAAHRALARETQPRVGRVQLMHLAVVETQAQPVARQQHQLAVDAGERRERRIALDLGDRQTPVPVLPLGTGDDLARPAQLVAPACPPVFVGGDHP